MLDTRRPRLAALSGLRFFAAVHVVLYHYLITVPGYRAAAPGWLRRLLATAPASVDLFFVLSGFILAYNYMRPDGGMKVDKREYFGSRFARIYPVYLLGMLVYLPIALARYLSGTGLSVVDVGPGPTFAVSGILTLLMVQAWTSVFTAWNGPCWSVSSEAFFYSIFPWAAPCIMNLRRRRIFWCLSGLWVVSLLAPAYFLFAILGHAGKQTKELWETTLTFNPLLRCLPFLIGVGVGVLFLRTRREGASRDGIVAALAGAMILIVCVSAPTSFELLLENCLTPVFALLLYSLAFERGALYRFLSHRVTVRLGEATFAMYILHNPLWNYLARLQMVVGIVFRKHFPVGLAKPGIQTEWNYDMNGWVFCVYLILLVGLSLLTLRYIEQPARAYLRRYFAERQRLYVQAQLSESPSQVLNSA